MIDRRTFRLKRIAIEQRVTLWWTRLRAPWPIVGECFSSYKEGHACEQCRPTHVHRWKAWRKAPSWVAPTFGVPVRCTICGARKCDFDDCNERRHDHTHHDGIAVPVIFEGSGKYA